ncbi:MAG: MFS transporter [Syntrophales bacterium]|nr:MFS transporter [Syntrophales bacterium]
MKSMGRYFGMGRNVFAAGLVSFFMDVSSEMVYPLIPLFLANVLGVNKSVIGLIEGIAESTASLLKVFSGWLSDRIGRRKGLMGMGYGISVLSRPLIALAVGWPQILASRFIDRLGKGIRTAPRDAIIAESSLPEVMGRAFGFHRAMDTLGAVVGPALAFFLLGLFAGDFRKVFWLSMIPGIIAVLLIVFLIQEKKRALPESRERPRLTLAHFDWRFKFFVVITTLFAIGNSSDVFLILRSQQLGIPTAVIPVLYLTFNLIYSLSAFPAGMAADRFGKKRIMMIGFILFAFIYYGFAVAGSATTAWVLFGLYGIFMGLTEGVQKAFLTTIIPSDFKATAFGIYNTAIGLALFPASLIGGWLWDRVSPAATFYYGSVMAAVSTLLFIAFIVILNRQAQDRRKRSFPTENG